MNSLKRIRSQLSSQEHDLLQNLRNKKPAQSFVPVQRTFGERVSDAVAEVMGSWRFFLVQSSILVVWIFWNSFNGSETFDPYPFILLNLMLSFQAAYAAAIIMMSQNRQANIDRLEAKHDAEINVKAELEIEWLQEKISKLQEVDISDLTEQLKIQKIQITKIENMLEDFIFQSKNKNSNT
jgi:uncharacterized membrane protein